MSKSYVVEALLNTFKAEKELFEECNVMVAGGVFTSLFTKKDVNDVDCYFRSKDDVVRFLNYINEYGDRRVCISVTDKSVTLVGGNVPIQLIYFKYFKDLQDVFNTFDFTISMCGYDFKTKELQYHDDFFSDVAQRRLQFNKQTAFPLVSALRVNKFIDRGYTISRSEMIKILLTVSQLEIKTVRQFVEQTGGFYGNAALAALSQIEDKDFTLEKGLEVLAKETEGSNPTINKIIEPVKDVKCGVHQLARLLHSDNPLDGGWYRDGTNAVYKMEGWRGKHTIPVEIALLFAPQNQVKEPKKDLPTGGMFYKWVRKTDEPDVFKSHYKNSFKYRIGEEIVANPDGPGLYFCGHERILNHHYKNETDNAMLMCYVELKDLVSSNGAEPTFSKVKPVAVVESPMIPSPVIPDNDKMFEIKISVNHCLDEELILEDVDVNLKSEEEEESKVVVIGNFGVGR